MFRSAVLTSIALLCAPAAHAQSSVVIWPLNPAIAPGEQATALWLENRGTEAVTLQIRALGWRQTEAGDVTERQDEVVGSPPLAEVAPGKRQLIRLIRRAPQGQPGERAYRLLIDELPKPVDEAAPAPDGAQLAVRMRYSVPLFTGAPKGAEPRLTTRRFIENGRPMIEVRNDGARHARLTDLRVAGQAAPLIPGLMGYVLAGAVRRWELPGAALAGEPLVAGVDGRERTLATAA